jgi:hypothetical protein
VQSSSDESVQFQPTLTWFEGNCATTGTYECYLDGSSAGTVQFRIRNTRFNSSKKSIYLKNVYNFLIDAVSPGTPSAAIKIDGTCSGAFHNWPDNNFNFATAVDLGASNDSIYFPDRYTDREEQIAWSTGGGSLTPSAYFAYHELDIIDGSAITLANPSNLYRGAPDQRFCFKNLGGVAAGALTLGSKYKTTGAITLPAAGKNRSIAFRYDGNSGNLYETWRSTGDVSN